MTPNFVGCPFCLLPSALCLLLSPPPLALSPETGARELFISSSLASLPFIFSPPAKRWHLAICPPPASCQPGATRRQRSHAASQRSANRQPVKSRVSGGTVPRITARGAPRLLPAGRESKSVREEGCGGREENAA